MEAELGQSVTVRNVFAVLCPKKKRCHVRLLQLLFKMGKSFLKVLKAFIAIGRIPAIEPMVQLRVLQLQERIDTQCVFIGHPEIALYGCGLIEYISTIFLTDNPFL